MSTYANSRNWIASAGGFARFGVPELNAGGQLSKLTKKVDILATLNENPLRALPVSSDTEYFEAKTLRGGSFKTPNNMRTINAQTGEAMASKSGSDSNDSMEITCYATEDDFKVLSDAAVAEVPIFGIMASGRRAGDLQIVGYQYLLGKISELSKTLKDSLAEIKFKITGGTAYTAVTDLDFADFNTLMCGTGNPIVPEGQTSETILEIVAADFTTMLSGKTVEKSTNLPALT